MIGAVKRCLRKVLGNARLSHDELPTVLTEMEGTLNSRPLTYYGDDVEEQALTPLYFIIGRRISPLSENLSISHNPDDIVGESNLPRRFVYLTTKLNHFWARWQKEYLLGLRETHRLQRLLPHDIAEGDPVLIQDQKTKRNTWKLGIIEELMRGSDQFVRGAKVGSLVKGKPEILNRSLHTLFSIESFQRKHGQESKIGKEVMEVKKDVSEEKNEEVGMKNERPRRAAAQNVHLKSRLMLEA